MLSSVNVLHIYYCIVDVFIHICQFHEGFSSQRIQLSCVIQHFVFTFGLLFIKLLLGQRRRSSCCCVLFWLLREIQRSGYHPAYAAGLANTFHRPSTHRACLVVTRGLHYPRISKICFSSYSSLNGLLVLLPSGSSSCC